MEDTNLQQNKEFAGNASKYPCRLTCYAVDIRKRVLLHCVVHWECIQTQNNEGLELSRHLSAIVVIQV